MNSEPRKTWAFQCQFADVFRRERSMHTTFAIGSYLSMTYAGFNRKTLLVAVRPQPASNLLHLPRPLKNPSSAEEMGAITMSQPSQFATVSLDRPFYVSKSQLTTYHR